MSTLISEKPSTLTTVSAAGHPDFWERGEREAAMKKVYVGVVLALTLLFAQAASAQSPCGGVCQAYYPCDYPCGLCVGDPGLWVDGGCWGEIVAATCGDIGQCGWRPQPGLTPGSSEETTSQDLDGDGIPQDFELRLAQHFFPTIWYDRGEDTADQKPAAR